MEFEKSNALETLSPFENSFSPKPYLDSQSALGLEQSLQGSAGEWQSLSSSNDANGEIVFIDSSVQDYQSLIAGIKPGTEVAVLDPVRNEVEQIGQYLANRSGISSVHIVSHGNSGSLQLGETKLGLDTLNNNYSSALQSWSKSLTADADILLYGCDVAAGDSGAAFVKQLSQLTGADVAASTDLTGSAALGGDWDLEFDTGNIETPEVFQSWAVAAYNSILAAFTPGNLAIYRVGDGIQALTANGNSVFLDEYTPTGTLVQSIAMPTTASGLNKQLIASGTAVSEGLLTRSTDGQYLLLTGYARDLGGSGGLPATSAAAINRVIGRVDGAGAINTTTALTDAASGSNPRSAASTNGTDLWFTGGTGGVRYANIGATTSTQLNTDAVNLRQVNIFNGQLYASSASGTNTFKGVNTVGTGLPTDSGQTVTRLPGLTDTDSPSSFGFFLADLDAGVAGVDTLYIADDGIAALTKFSLVGGSWTDNGTVGVDADDYRGLTATVSGNSVTLFATGGTTGASSKLVSLVDASGYNGAFVGTPTQLAIAGTNTAFRGVALAPQQLPTVSLTATNDPSATESSTGAYQITRTSATGALMVKLNLDAISSATAADYSLSVSAGGTITVDTVSSTATVVLDAGVTSVDLTLTATDDIQAEAAETLTLNLATDAAYTIGTANTGTVTIDANDTVVINNIDSGEGTLRQAILNANAFTGTDTITFSGPVFTDVTPDAIALTSGELLITDSLIIQGTGANNLTISGNNASRIFYISAGNATLDGLTITGGNDSSGGGGILQNIGTTLNITNSNISGNTTSGVGGGIYSDGTLNVTNSTISDNTASNIGGGIYSDGTLNVTNSTISDNTATFYGGGIYSGGTLDVTNSTISGNTSTYYGGGIYSGGTLDVTNSTISGNTATTFDGGGIYSGSGGTLDVTNSTISGNEAALEGGGIYNDGTATLTNATITDNDALNGGGVYQTNGGIEVKNTIIAGNESPGQVSNPDISIGNNGVPGSFTSLGNNLIGISDGEIGFVNGVSGDIVGTSTEPIDPLLGPLANNGGSTFTHALLLGSPAINAGNGTGIPETDTDQRGSGFARSVGGAVDIGALESPFIPGTLEFSAPIFSVNEDGISVVSVIVNRTGGADGAVSATVTPSDGTATTPDDYDNSAIAVNFADGDTAAKIVTIPLIDDNLVEGNETVNLSLGNLTGGASLGTQNTAVLTIGDNDVAEISIGDFTVTEGNTPDSFTVNLSNPSTQTITVDYSTTDGTATAGSDYTALTTNTLTFNPGETSKTIAVAVTDDTTFEGNETFNVNLSNASANAAIADNLGVGTIASDDAFTNNAPVANSDALSTLRVEPITISRADLLVNDTDIDGDSLSIVGFTQPSNGTLVDNGNGTFTYTPNTHFGGTDSFTYTISDGQGGTANSLVNLTVNTEDGIFNLVQTSQFFNTPDLTASSVFDESFYLAQNPDVAQAVAGGAFRSGFEHFQLFGQAEDRDPSLLFNNQLYLQQNPDVERAVAAGSFQSGFEHFLLFGQHERRDLKSLIFDEGFYLENNPDIAQAVSGGGFRSGFDHFIRFGEVEGRNPSVLFDEGFYLENNPDIAQAVSGGGFRSGFDHFIRFGIFEDRDFSRLFDNSLYLTQNLDVAQAVSEGRFRSGFDHFIHFGQFGNRQPQLQLFDEGFYLANNSDVAEAVAAGGFDSGFDHFIRFGQAEGRNPSVLFDEGFYLRNNLDVAGAVAAGSFRSGFEHFLRFGRTEGRSTVG